MSSNPHVFTITRYNSFKTVLGSSRKRHSKVGFISSLSITEIIGVGRKKKKKKKKERVFLHAISDRYIKASRKNVIRSYLKSEF